MALDNIYVVGHRNPDTDSICSAMAYARLCQRQGRDQVQPARAGTLNRQTEFVLEELGLPVPRLLTDVYPRVADIIGDHVVTIPAEAPVSRAMELFHLHHIRQLPVVDNDGLPLGLLVLKRITERFLIPRQEADIRRVATSPITLAACLQAEILHGRIQRHSDISWLFETCALPPARLIAREGTHRARALSPLGSFDGATHRLHGQSGNTICVGGLTPLTLSEAYGLR
jgi:CBS domain-containing protein